MKNIFHHVALTVQSIDKAAEFYHNIFGFEVIRTHFIEGHVVVAHLKQPEGTFILELIKSDERGLADQAKIHLAFKCPDLSLFQRELEQVRPGIATSPMKIGVENVMFIRDTDGYVIEVNDGLL